MDKYKYRNKDHFHKDEKSQYVRPRPYTVREAVDEHVQDEQLKDETDAHASIVTIVGRTELLNTLSGDIPEEKDNPEFYAYLDSLVFGVLDDPKTKEALDYLKDK